MPHAHEIDVADLQALAHLLPPSAVELVRAVGPQAACALLRELPGVQVFVPKHQAANAAGARRWEQLSRIVGAGAMPGLLRHYGGNVIDIPLCLAATVEKRNRWIRSRFDELTNPRGANLSKRSAVYEIGLEIATVRRGMTYRQIERAIDSADSTDSTAAEAAAEAESPQTTLFPTP